MPTLHSESGGIQASIALAHQGTEPFALIGTHSDQRFVRLTVGGNQSLVELEALVDAVSFMQSLTKVRWRFEAVSWRRESEALVNSKTVRGR